MFWDVKNEPDPPPKPYWWDAYQARQRSSEDFPRNMVEGVTYFILCGFVLCIALPIVTILDGGGRLTWRFYLAYKEFRRTWRAIDENRRTPPQRGIFGPGDFRI